MHILMVSDVYFPRINGVSTSISAFRSELQKQGHRVTLVVPAYVQATEFDADIVRVPGRAVPGDPEDRLMSRRALRAALDRLSDRDIDVVHVQTPFRAHYAATRYARLRGIPCVETYHTFFEEYFHHYVRFLPAGLTRFAARFFTRRQAAEVDLLVVPSRAMEERLQAYGVRTRTRVLPTGLQAADYRAADPGPFLRAQDIDPLRPRLVHVGRIAHEKNLGFLLEVLNRVRRAVPGVLMLIAGEGPALESLRRRSAELGLERNVRFLGYLARDGELQACYAAGDVFLFSSRTETQGLVLLEAMAAGTPVVSTAVMGTRDILDAGRGALVAADDIGDFADKVMQLLQDAELRKSLSAEAKAYAREWTAGRFARELIEVYRSMKRPGR
jgi:glycosyltransferase involved in cell wall biosynthesis